MDTVLEVDDSIVKKLEFLYATASAYMMCWYNPGTLLTHKINLFEGFILVNIGLPTNQRTHAYDIDSKQTQACIIASPQIKLCIKQM